MSEIEKKRREVIREIISSRGLTVNGWCKKAGIAESTLRSYLSEENASMGLRSITKLASAIDIPLSTLTEPDKENKPPISDFELTSIEHAQISSAVKYLLHKEWSRTKEKPRSLIEIQVIAATVAEWFKVHKINEVTGSTVAAALQNTGHLDSGGDREWE